MYGRKGKGTRRVRTIVVSRRDGERGRQMEIGR